MPHRTVQHDEVETVKVPDRLRDLCEAYDQTREDMVPGTARTRKMTAIFEEMKTQAPLAQASLREFKVHESAGFRLAAIAILQVFPSKDDLKWLAKCLDPNVEKPFVGYHAAVALAQAVRSLSMSDCSLLHSEVARALALAKLNPDDPPRIQTLEYALKELAVKCSTKKGQRDGDPDHLSNRRRIAER
ncbi:hypothetical protein DBIPINDM_001877 [Mesorhizobium sp. AR02]|uniref:hypothetical protein n=1 Tax=Mesorhizobium sp. AR02 TaxID=2865837 RepID=UPI0021606EA4|nr:hypothetical protein [Mesorhizobium sp. AR02]UVK55369.1 hypothetical protein DBIPINDM_001877 [Mesorhizobium sp. AR02]